MPTIGDSALGAPKDVWLMADGTRVDPNTPGSQRHTIQVLNNGQIWETVWNGGQQGDWVYIDTDPQLASQFRQDNPQLKEPSVVSQWVTKVDPETGKTFRLNEATGTKEEVFGADPNAASKDKAYTDYYNAQAAKIIAETPNAEERSLKLDELRASIAAHMRSGTRTAAQEATDAAQSRLYTAQAAKAEQGLISPLVLQQQQLYEAIGNIKDQILRRDITPQEGDRLIALARSNLEAAMRGTTPWQMEQNKQQMEQDRQKMEETRRNNQLTLANNFVQNRGQLGGSLATGFLSGLGGIYGKILGSTNPPAIDPLAMASSYTNQMYGGSDINDMALALLRGYMSQGGAGMPPAQGGM